MPFLLVLNLIIPIVMILVGALLKKYPADMESHTGYNTPASRKSRAHWDYAQSIAPDIFLSLGKRLGVIEIVFSAVMLIVHASAGVAVGIGCCVGAGFLFYGFYKTESEIEKKFQ